MVVARLPSLNPLDPELAWQPWKPDEKQPFDLKWAGHLYRRATFGANLATLRQAVARGPQPTLDLLCNGEDREGELASFLHGEGAKIARRNNLVELRVWWLYTML